MIWRVEVDERARKELRNLDRTAQANILNYLRERIATNEDPRRFGNPLRKNLSGFWKYRIGAYRVICDIVEDVVTVRVIRIGHRKDVYE
ncbi:MAG: type II toxin-antitoxin system RelE/ParE family toxin [Thermodesulfobacteriota bacterium]|nr:type II toxin-antitoxin system RelE/ParE family toxin [Thermodesulfobacteriota bacterium]